MEEGKVMVDTQGFLIGCPRFNATLKMEECEKCEFHVRIENVWPGDGGNVVTVKAAEMIEGTFVNSDNVDTGKVYQYDRICGLPTRARAVKFFKFPDKTEE